MDSFLKIMYSSTNLKEIYSKKRFDLNTLGETKSVIPWASPTYSHESCLPS